MNYLLKENTYRLFILLILTVLPVLRVNAEDKIVFNFESGDLKTENWFLVEGVNTQPIGCRDQTFHFDRPYPKEGKYYLTMLEDKDDKKTHESQTCILESPVFRPTGAKFSFLLGGGNIPETWLALAMLKDNGDIVEIRQFRGKNEQTMEHFELDLTPYLGKPLLFRMIDHGTGAWSYLHADAFYGTGTIDLKATKLRRDFLQSVVLNCHLNRLFELLDRYRKSSNGRPNVESLKKDIVFMIDECQRLRTGDNSIEERIQRSLVLLDQAQTMGRDMILADPVINAQPILYVSRPQFPYEHHNTETTYQTDDICTRLMPQTGSSLKLWDPQSKKVQVLLDVPTGIVRDPCIHFDAKRILVSIRWDIKDDFHIYELDLTKYRIVGRPLKREEIHQLTFGSGLSDIDPQYLPNGRIVFSSSREPKYCMCNRHIMVNLHTMNGDGSNILQIGHSTLYEGHSTLLPDGRILYYRWEYVDRNFSDAEGAWTVNPDGTNHALFWGNNTESPATTIDPRIMPGTSSEYICTMTACHISPWGAIGIIDRQLGLDGKKPVVHVWPKEAWNLIGTYTGQSYDLLTQLSQFFEDPYPIDEEHIICAGTIPKGTLIPKGEGDKPGITGIWFLDLDGSATLLHTDPVGCFDPMPLVQTEVPPVITDRVDLSKNTGNFYVTDVNEGFGMDKVSRGMAKYIRVIESPEKRFWTPPSWVGIDGKGNQQAPGMNWDEFGNKRILGFVPIEEDGSVFFTIPSDRFVFFQLLDENKEMIQSMRSGVIVRPGETNGCFGCHEDRLETPASTRVTKAMQKAPQALIPEFGREPFLFSYNAEVQPILDKYCVVCHDWSTEKSTPLAKRASAKLLLCGDLNPAFNCSYWDIREKKMVQVIGSAYAEKIKPLTWGARYSKIVDIMKHGHDNNGPIDLERSKLGVSRVDASAITMTAAWVDLNAPYYPDFSSGFPDNPYGRSPLSFEETDLLAKLTGYISIHNQMAWGGRVPLPLEPAISFTRPEISPCLKKWDTSELRQTKEYQQALALINLGANRLKTTPREDMSGWKLTNPIEIKRKQKYDVFQERANRMREAAFKGIILLDKDNQIPFKTCLP